MHLPFEATHIGARPGDLDGNGGRGRYLLVPGSAGRARKMAERFDGVIERPSPRGHDLFLGTLPGEHGPVDVGVISTGMGAPSAEIILTELMMLGGRRFMRVGTSGSMQPDRARPGDLVVATAAVRDESTTARYAPPEVPSVGDFGAVAALDAACAASGAPHHVGVVHSKDAFWAREFGHGPLHEEHAAYRAMLTANGVVATEMEVSVLYTLAAVHDQRVRPLGQRVKAGAVLLIIGEADAYSDRAAEIAAHTERMIAAALDGVRRWDGLERTP